MTNIDQTAVYMCLLDSYQPSSRKPRGPGDWGDQDTVGLQLKKRGLGFYELEEEDYGVYLGHHEGIGYVVAIKKYTFILSGGEVFGTIEEMKERWWLD